MINFANDTLSIALPQNFTDKDVMPIVKGLCLITIDNDMMALEVIYVFAMMVFATL